ncbi:AAA family ATPase [Microbacterium enclense]|uniref:AAA family ATPase n=1 Tax=Microbacterium enclense TaxID=993073 RepID=UPI002042118C|nr:AAA family ATPase [Microbacterium enclense]MCM3614604.1 AAA family ATPase [Microbacterium enclense]
MLAALEAMALGFGVFPLAPGRKVPLFPNAHKNEKRKPGTTKCTGQCGQIGHGAHDGTTDPEKIRRWFREEPRAGLGGNTRFLVGFDIDIQHGGRLLDSFPTTRTHYSGRGNGNRHLIYAYEPGSLASKIAQRNGWLTGVDVKAGRGAYLVLPPTLHEETGKPYTVGDDNGGVIHVLTDDDVHAIATEAGADLPGLAQKPEAPAGGSPSPSRDLFATSGHREPSKVLDALRNPPARGQGVTNDWLATVAGHYARAHRENRDFYEVEVRRAIAMVDPHYEDASKTIDSIWDKEHSTEGERAWAVAQRVEAKLVEHEAKAVFARTLAELEPADPFDAGSLAEILARPDSTRFRVDGLVLSEGFTTVVAARKTGKTTFNLNLADSLLSGRDFLGRFPVEPVEGRIALLNFEVAAKQVAHWANLVGVDPERFDIVTLRGRRNPLLHPQDRADLAEYLRGREVEFLFVDPLSRAFYGDNANDNTQMQRFLSDLDAFARSEVGATDVVLNVHAGWNADRSRGASATEDHPDSIIWLKPGDREKGDKSTYVEAKGRDVDVEEMQLAFDPTTYRLSLTGEGSRREVRQVQKQGDLEPQILRAVAADPGINTQGVTNALREAKARFQKGDETRTLGAMFDGGRIGKKKGRYNATLWYPAGHPDAETRSPLGGLSGEEF